MTKCSQKMMQTFFVFAITTLAVQSSQSAIIDSITVNNTSHADGDFTIISAPRDTASGYSAINQVGTDPSPDALNRNFDGTSYGNNNFTGTFTFGGYTPGQAADVYITWPDYAPSATSPGTITVNGVSVGVPSYGPDPVNTTGITAQRVDDSGPTILGTRNFEFLSATTANGSGEVVVSLTNNGGNFTYADAVAVAATPASTPAPAPEPSTAILLGLALVGLAFRGRRRNRSCQ